MNPQETQTKASFPSTAPMTNPIFPLFERMRNDVTTTREKLFKELMIASPDSGYIIKQFFHEEQSRNLTPPLGEILPWLLGELAGTRKSAIEGVAVGWLGVYIYGILIDRRADAGRDLNAKEQLASLLLLSLGLKKLYGAVSGTSYDRSFSEHLATAVRGQLDDLQSNKKLSSVNRLRYTISKNSSLLCAAAAVAAVTEKPKIPVLRLTKQLRLALQLLDDITDWEGDASLNNHTMLLTEASRYIENKYKGVVALNDIPSSEIAAVLIESGALRRVLTLVHRLLSNGVVGTLASIEQSASTEFFKSLRENVDYVRTVIDRSERNLPVSSPTERSSIIENTMKELTLVAQGT
ncbi:MAG: hypothetical protein JW763_05595 [candidate division Zixibacteria bacterium]|nr:hypothetical protein [candidate division Zixibacteria bacterium]